LQERRHDVDDVVELGPDRSLVLDPGGPGNDQRIARAAEMRGDLLPPLEGGIHRPHPADRNIIVGLWTANLVDVFGEIGRVFAHAVERRHFIEGAVESPFHRSAVVADLPHDNRVVALPDIPNRVQDSPNFMIGLGRKRREDLHQSRLDLLLVRRERIPSRNLRWAGCELGDPGRGDVMG
jgi:hypothetical protein